jgi:hypothetical protein
MVFERITPPEARGLYEPVISTPKDTAACCTRSWGVPTSAPEMD